MGLLRLGIFYGAKLMFFESFQPYTDSEPAGVKLPKIEIDQNLLSQLQLPPESSSYDILKALSREGIKKRGIDKYPNKKEYYDRAKYELETFDELGFSDYVLLNWEIIGYAKSIGVPVGEARGSSCSSLILYLLNVVEKDPVKYGLFFERFVSKSRAKKITDIRGEVFLDGSLLPDVDSDFSYDRRAEVIKFIEEKHKGRTSKILTFNTFSSKLCIREAAKYFDKAGEEDANLISDMIPKKHGVVSALDEAGELSEKFQDWTNRNKFTFSQALKVEDLIKNEGVHPSGIAICAREIDSVAPLSRTKEGDLVVAYDMKDTADLMVKFDILGLRTLTIADLACKKIGIMLEEIDAEDPFIYEKLQNFNHPAGLFQISAETNFRVTQDVKPINLEELADVVALARPASLQFVGEYVKQKNFPKQLGINDELDKILFRTKNTMLYQEQTLQACVRVFGMSPESAESLRRAIGKKLQDEIPQWKEKIFNAAKEKNLTQEVAQYFWNVVELGASYQFCLSPDSVVETQDGDKCLFEINIGDKILAFDTKTGLDHFVTVSNIFHSREELFEFEFDDGRTIKCSMKHKFLCDDGIMRPIRDILYENYAILCKE